MKHLTALFFKAKTRSAAAGNRKEEECRRAMDRPNVSTLPVELVLEITDYLSPVDTACLALCTRGLLATLGGWRHYPSLMAGESRDEHESALFLTTLSHDLEGHFFCPYCCRLHSRSRVGPPGPAFQPSKSLRCLDEERVVDVRSSRAGFPYQEYRLFFAHVHLALKRQWYGLNHGISPESLAFTGVYRQHEEKAKTKRSTLLLSVEFRTCPQPTTALCLRVQSWNVISTTDPSKTFRGAEVMGVCHHLLSALSNFLFQSKSSNEPSESEGYQGVPGVFSCPARDAETQLEVRELFGEGAAVVLTRWVDLGDGITPPDLIWDFKHPGIHLDKPLTSRDTGDARSRFESQPGRSLDCLSRRNASLLTGGRYRTEMDHWHFGVWILQGERRLPFLSSVLRRIGYYLFEDF